MILITKLEEIKVLKKICCDHKTVDFERLEEISYNAKDPLFATWGPS